MSQESLELVLKRNIFYRKHFYSLLIANIMAALFVITVVGYLVYQSKTEISAKYFATTPDAQIIVDPPVNQNHLKLSEQNIRQDGLIIGSPEVYLSDLTYRESDPDNALVMYWTEKASRSLYDYDYVNYPRALQDTRDYFTNVGHQDFILKLYNSNNLRAVKANKWIVSATIPKKSEVLRTGLLKGHAAWRIMVPLDVRYDNTIDKPETEKLNAEIKLVRVSTLQSPFYGLAIFQTIISTRLD